MIQDHFLSGERFCELGNYIEQTIGQIEGRNDFPYFPTTEKMNLLLRDNSLVRTFEKTGFAMDVNLYKRMLAKAKNNSRLDIGLIR